MNGKLTYTLSMAFGILSLILLVTDITMINSNRHLQDDANARQAEISKAQSLTSLYQGIVEALAQAADKNNDVDARALLTAQGITLAPKGAPAAASAAAPAPATKPAKK